jgi:hypothetical protein
LGSHIELLVGSSFSTVHSVKIHSSNGPTTTVTTAATNPCH